MITYIRNAWIFSGDHDDFVYGGLVIQGKRIEKLVLGMSEAEMTPLEGNIQNVDAQGGIILPGQINAHHHGYAHLLKGTINDRPLDLWSLYTVAYGHALTDEDIRLAVLVGAIEMIRSGYTSVLEHFPHLPRAEAALSAYEDSGLRTAFAPMLHDRQDHRILPVKLPQAIQERLDRIPSRTVGEMKEYLRNLYTHWHHREERLTIVLGPNAPQRCSTEMLELCKSLSEQNDLRVHMHLLETKIQRAIGERIYPGGTVAYLERLGLLNPRLSVAHAVWLDDKDIQLLQAYGVTVVHNPASNLTLGSGYAPIGKYLKQGIPVALGSDAANCGGPTNPWEIMRLSLMLNRLHEPDYSQWLHDREVWKMSTLGGASVLGMEDRLGKLRPGYYADLILLKSDTHVMTPRNNILNQLVHQETGHSIDSVMINGEWVMRNNEIQTFDENSTLRNARERQGDVMERCREAVQFATLQEPFYDEMYKRFYES